MSLGAQEQAVGLTCLGEGVECGPQRTVGPKPKATRGEYESDRGKWRSEGHLRGDKTHASPHWGERRRPGGSAHEEAGLPWGS